MIKYYVPYSNLMSPMILSHPDNGADFDSNNEVEPFNDHSKT